MNTINDPSIIHETVIRDIVSLITDTPINVEKIKNNLTSTSKFSYRNIARASKDLTLTFPVIVSDAVSVETASMISKAIERKAVTMLQMLFSAIQITNADNALAYLKNFHSNINADSNMGVDDWISIGNVMSTREEAIEYSNFDIDAMNEANALTHLSNAGKELTKAIESAYKSAKRGITRSADKTSKIARAAAVKAGIETESFAKKAHNATRRMAKKGEKAARLGAEDVLDGISSSSNSLAAKIAAASEDIKKANKSKYGLREDCGFEIIDAKLFEEAVRNFREFGEFYLEETYSDRSLNDYMVDMAHDNRVTLNEGMVTNVKPQPANAMHGQEQRQVQMGQTIPGSVNSVRSIGPGNNDEEEKPDMITKGVNAYNKLNGAYNTLQDKVGKYTGYNFINNTAMKIPGAKKLAAISGGLATAGLATGALGSGAQWLGSKLGPDNLAGKGFNYAGKALNGVGKLGDAINLPKKLADYAGDKLLGNVKLSNLANTSIGKTVAQKFGSATNFVNNAAANTKTGNMASRFAGRMGQSVLGGAKSLANTNAYRMVGKVGQYAMPAMLVGLGLNYANQWRLNRKAKKEEEKRRMMTGGYQEEAMLLNEHQGNAINGLNSLTNIARTATQLYDWNQDRALKPTMNKTKLDRDLAAIQKDLSDIQSNQTNYFSKQIIPTEVQKANEVVPSMMLINFVSKGDGEHPITSQAVIGVKARLQYVSSKDMMERIASKNDDRNGLFNLIKATTGQISFWKDFVFALDKAKVDSVASSGKGSSSPVWKMLERRATMSRIKRWTGSVNDAAAISTIVISKEEVDAIKKNEHMDLYRINNVHSVMNGYNIMGFIIVDESLEKASFLFDDGSSSFETVSFTHLERQGNDGGAYKKVINLLTKNR